MYTTATINGYKFGFSYGDGVVIHPKNIRLDDPIYLKSLQIAVDLVPIAERYMDLEHECHNGFYGKVLNRVTEPELSYTLDLFNAVNNNPYIVISGEVMDFVNGVAVEYKARQEKAEAKALEKATQKVKRLENAKGYVYLIQSPSGAYKIGRTTNPDDRIKTFEVKLPFEVGFICVIPTSNMYELESRLHRQFAKKRINGEWFSLTPNDIQYIESLAVQNGQ